MENNGNGHLVLEFFTDETSQSERIRAFLDQSGIDYREIPASGYNVPAVEYAGTRYDTLEGIFMVVHDLAPNKDLLKARAVSR